MKKRILPLLPMMLASYTAFCQWTGPVNNRLSTDNQVDIRGILDVNVDTVSNNRFRFQSNSTSQANLMFYTGGTPRWNLYGGTNDFIVRRASVSNNGVGFNAFRIYGNGKVAIGDANTPQSQLYVQGDGTLKDLIVANDGGIAITGGNSVYHSLRFDDTTGVHRHLIYIDHNNDILFGNQNFRNLRIVNNDILVQDAHLSVGGGAFYSFSVREQEVNKTAALFQFNSIADLTFGGAGLFLHNENVTDAASSAIRFDMTDPGGGQRHVANISAIKDPGWIADDPSTYRAHLSFWTRPGQGAQEERMRITADGDVGIGTTEPSNKLTVLGGTIGWGDSFVGSALSQSNSLRETTLASNMKLVFLADQVNTGNSDKQIVFGAGAESTNDPDFVEYMRINQGNVGIGTTNPQAKLAVDGDILATKVKVVTDVNAVPDYVFADDYNLTSLEEVAQYIQKNKHLPEVPSATEMSEQGQDLGVMNLLLLKKIEELTLYLIEECSQNQKQREEIDELRQELHTLKRSEP